jgi:hypothetical protein
MVRKWETDRKAVFVVCEMKSVVLEVLVNFDNKIFAYINFILIFDMETYNQKL